MYSDAETKGDTGEVLTADGLRTKCNMQVIRNIYLPLVDHFTEIDMIGIHTSGIYIIENKNYSATIRGGRDDKYWHIKYSTCKGTMYNPIMQNRMHYNILCKVLSSDKTLSDILKERTIYNTVIFNDNAVLKLKDDCKCVFNLSDFIEHFNETDLPIYYTTEEMSIILNYLRTYSNISDDMKLVHRYLLKETRK
jgi:hypothetical protein